MLLAGLGVGAGLGAGYALYKHHHRASGDAADIEARRESDEKAAVAAAAEVSTLEIAGSQPSAAELPVASTRDGADLPAI